MVENLNDSEKRAKFQELLQKTSFQTSGFYHIEDGKIKEGKSERREVSLFSNWNGANPDPDDYRKHREMLDRQHFMGPFWEGKKRPPTVEEDPSYYNPALISSDDPEHLAEMRELEKFKKEEADGFKELKSF